MNKSDLGTNRWDAGFHILRQAHQAKADALSRAISADEAVSLLTNESVFPTEFLFALKPLVRGSKSESNAREPLIRAIQEYPFLALAIVSGSARSMIRRQQTELAHKAAELARVDSRLRDLDRAPVSHPKPVHKFSGELPGLSVVPDDRKALLGACRYVAGVVYRLGDELAIPVYTESTAHTSDCWVVDVSKWAGPETLEEMIAYGESPVSRRHDEIGVAIGFVVLPDDEKDYGMDCR